MNWLFAPAPQPSLPIAGEATLFPVHRVFCVGRNYVEHVLEMGNEVDREAPFYFTKSAYAVSPPGNVAYPPGTSDLHHEVELVLAIGAPLFRATPEQARAAIIAYAVGLDLTRRDLQAQAKEKRRPWDTSKDFEQSAVIAPLSRATPGPDIRLSVNGTLRQESGIDQMIFGPVELLCHLSTLYHLEPGDLVMTGTPAGVAPLVVGDQVRAEVDGLPPLEITVTG
ncbi:fumarylacetoacetate hydrolase family protein [Paracoccus pacificus]|uniref:Fumarylacetoacetate hydrolase family protein n=1 Tax=Paracoccus pacificus TaxID=1463598 RepID=A0ABW4R679_9RHOB